MPFERCLIRIPIRFSIQKNESRRWGTESRRTGTWIRGFRNPPCG